MPSDAPPANTTIDATSVTQSNIPALDSLDKAITELDGFVKAYKAISENLKQSVKEINAVKASFVKTRKDVEKAVRKGKKNAKRITDPSRPTGFKKPIPISPELAKFLGVKDTDLMSRTDVTKAINNYIKDHKLQDPDAKREFILNKTAEGKALHTLLKPTDEKPVSYFNLQRWLAPHFPKQEATAVVTPPPAPAAAVPAAPVRRRAPAKR